ncbi:MAG: glycosyltransferase family 9 protein [Candidatus Omnitrophica bacterium]|nr:glycosyltransferase family 9 protein [Candidatus Omnitrophota bacterium]
MRWLNDKKYLLFSTPLVSAIKKAYPESYIAYICNLKVKDILNTNPDINEVFVFERDEYRNLWKKSKIQAVKKFFSFWEQIKKRKFDIVFDLSLGKEYAFFCWRAGIKDRRGFDYKRRGRFLNNRSSFKGFNDKPVAEYYLDLLSVRRTGPLSRSANGIIGNTVLITTDEDKRYIDNFLTKSGINSNDTLVGIAPGGGMSFGQKNQDRRRWSVKKFAELADKINAKVVLIWGPGEENLVKEITSLMKQKPLIAPFTKIREMAELCKRCKLVICSEGGPLHIASSQGVKTISIFGPVDDKVYGPYPKREKDIVVTSDADCRPCYKKFKLPECEHKKCLESISVNKLYNLTMSVLSSS